MKDGQIGNAFSECLNLMNFDNLVPRDSKVVIKPNLCQLRLDPGAVTTPQLIHDLVRRLEGKTRNIVIGESDLINFPLEKAYEGIGLEKFIEDTHARFLNFSKDEWVKVEVDGLFLKSIELPKTLVDADVFISMPVLKTHKLTTITMGLKNQFGCVPRSDRLIYHPNLDEVLVDLNAYLKPIVIMDGVVGMEADGPVHGVPVKMDLILGSTNVVALDATACRIIGIDPWRVGHLKLAHLRGVGPIGEEEISVKGATIREVQRKFQQPSNDMVVRIENMMLRHSPKISKLVYRTRLFPIVKWLAWRVRDLTGYTKKYSERLVDYYSSQGQEMPDERLFS